MNANVDLSELAIERAEPPAPARPRPHLMTRYVLPLALLLGFAALVVWSLRDVLRPPLEVEVIKVMEDRAEVQPVGTPLFKAAGWIEPRPTAIRVAALAPGVVEDLLVVEDQAVTAGQPIAELIKEDSELRLQHARAAYDLRTANVKIAAARLAAAETRYEVPSHLEAPLAAAKAQWAKIETDLANLPHQRKRAEADLVYNRNNYESKKQAGTAVAARELDQAKSLFDSSLALVAELRAREASLLQEKQALETRVEALEDLLDMKPDEKQAVDEAKAQLAANQALAEQARVAVDEAELRLSRMTIRAPTDGRVLALNATPGTRVASGAVKSSHTDDTTVVTMYRPQSLQVRVDVRFEDLPRVQVEQPVTIESPAVAAPLSGRVLFISSRADIQKNTLEVKVDIEDPPSVFKPEMLVDVTFLAPPVTRPAGLSASEQAMRIYVPRRLIRQEGGETIVWVADVSDGVARRTPVETGVRAGELVEVTTGLTVASRLITTPPAELRDGRSIRIIGESNEEFVSASNPLAAAMPQQEQ
ncbi:MAG: efflux RND transporter periplasmic adaptor subunit [Planctomycetota bacterium]|nr:MAG: efflux RND transporter periplasmic adaptor subunit [Planctomycetota bacterium]REJ88304.1 MAG: efflux RND transporter periplasmic adaptor subunit [Planctomycetota bacterium]REK22951.1 MAG: efflux RND transporter periplasmic adaptor subunit [Planctomycetota bacterium]REK44754.1 MAG: efflux RND transporter periplasmic adaptor subunit [Planctomycetota bacterium]